MIKSLELHNFQSHKQSSLEFDPGVNVIIGPSDSGKTAIIRALRWLVWNRPSGDAMRSTWGGDTQVNLKIGEVIITRSKGKAEEYSITGDWVWVLPDPPPNESFMPLSNDVFKAFGTTVPVEITQALNLNEINLQQQLDSPFLLTDSSGEVAKHFNKVAHLDQIDSGLKNVQSWLNEIARAITSDEQREQQLTEELKEFKDLDKFEIEVEILERQQTSMITMINQKRTLDSLIEELGEIDLDIEEQEEILKAEPLLNKILGWIEDRDDKENTRSKLRKLIEMILYTTEKQIAAENRSKRLQTEFNAVFPSTCPLCGKPK